MERAQYSSDLPNCPTISMEGQRPQISFHIVLSAHSVSSINATWSGQIKYVNCLWTLLCSGRPFNWSCLDLGLSSFWDRKRRYIIKYTCYPLVTNKTNNLRRPVLQNTTSLALGNGWRNGLVAKKIKSNHIALRVLPAVRPAPTKKGRPDTSGDWGQMHTEEGVCNGFMKTGINHPHNPVNMRKYVPD